MSEANMDTETRSQEGVFDDHLPSTARQEEELISEEPGKEEFHVEGENNVEQPSETSENVQPSVKEEEEEGDDDDFGSFDEASFDEYQEPMEDEKHSAMFESSVFQNMDLFDEKLDQLMKTVIPDVVRESPSADEPLLGENATLHLHTLLKTPRLHPPNWTKLKIRHSLLIKLGVPINLDELDHANMKLAPPVVHHRRRSISEEDIDWRNISIPKFEDLNIGTDSRAEMMSKTQETISRIENDNLNNTSELFLKSSAEDSLDAKLKQMRGNYNELLQLSAVWQSRINELRSEQEIYESVVQNMVGYSQKLQRNEMLDKLSRTKTKKGKRTF